ncbi:hypothetical protein OTB20_19310 [Streptomyces sp. H27-H1]|uniref:hypothetical protein n=1 Tax=Streptomyces sp. H27-H1 TaxID=2996461 RepID=UPI00226DC8AD|nr:hypothetical protein [Streptomyces sp. H27-H1]MCY0928305.1 hypothetical protein [Streptomyces sp. H27-H1]
MAAPDIKPHVDAVVTALAGAGLVVGDGVAPAPVPSTGIYVVVYFDPGQALTESLADARTDFTLSFQVTCVGPTPEKCRWATQRTRTALHAPLAVAGRTAWRPEELGGPPIQRDDDVSPPLYFLPVQYRLQSTA